MKSVYSLLGENPTIWVFGYGSLLWKPDFGYKSKKIGYVKDYERRFYQGNITFRGKPGQPGRVANLVEVKGSQAWGVAYEINGREEVAEVLKSLYNRESTGGGYVTLVTTFYPRDDKSDKSIVPVSKRDNEYSLLGLNEQSHDHHRTQCDLERSDSSTSDKSIGEVSTDEDQVNSQIENPPRKSDSFNVAAPQEQVHLSDLHYSDENHNREVANLINYLHSYNNENRANDEFHVNNENSEQFKVPPSYNILKKIHNTRVANLPVQVLLYTATSDNDLYLGPDDVHDMARQIVGASGSAGSNVEYITKTADFVRKYIPEDQDSHLFSLDSKVREEVYRLQARDSARLRLGLADLTIDQHDNEQSVIAEPIMAS